MQCANKSEKLKGKKLLTRAQTTVRSYTRISPRAYENQWWQYGTLAIMR